MKYRIYSITLLLILIFNILRFEIPYIQYEVFKTYIAKNLCINKDKPKSCCEGKCFLEKQIKIVNETNESQSSTENNQNKIPQNKEVKEFLPSKNRIPKAEEKEYTTFESRERIITTRYVSAVFVPPKV